jgi:glyoxylase-like metal-dependent hydrolase (beta-lactamase superfamily II)
MKRLGIAALGLAAIVFSAPAIAQGQPDFSKIQVKTTDLGHNTYMLEGAGGNVTIAVGTNGVIMVDSQFAPMHDKLKAAIAAITNQPVKYLIDTHYHGDHTGGNAAFGKEGVTIVAQQNVKERLLHPQPGANGQTPPVAPAEALPVQVYKDKTTVSIGGRTAQVGYLPNAHTDGDSYVYFADANVLATGDLNGAQRNYTNPDIRGGGGINGIVAGFDTLLKVANNQTKVVPGHGPLSTRADLVATRAALVTIRDRVAKMKAAGMSEDQVVAAKPAADIQAKRGADDMVSERFVRLVYQTVDRK